VANGNLQITQQGWLLLRLGIKGGEARVCPDTGWGKWLFRQSGEVSGGVVCVRKRKGVSAWGHNLPLRQTRFGTGRPGVRASRKKHLAEGMDCASGSGVVATHLLVGWGLFRGERGD
jgi:hypothetical protein